MSHSWPITQCPIARTWESAPKQWAVMTIVEDFRDSFETINWLYLLFKCGIKTKAHFEWLLWHWSSLGQLNLEPTRPNGLVGCKVPTDLVEISVKEATHMGFHYIIPHPVARWAKTMPGDMFFNENLNLKNLTHCAIANMICHERYDNHPPIPAIIWCYCCIY